MPARSQAVHAVLLSEQILDIEKIQYWNPFGWEIYCLCMRFSANFTAAYVLIEITTKANMHAAFETPMEWTLFISYNTQINFNVAATFVWQRETKNICSLIPSSTTDKKYFFSWKVQNCPLNVFPLIFLFSFCASMTSERPFVTDILLVYVNHVSVTKM